MKNVIKYLAIIALVAVIGFSMITCGDDDNGGGDKTPDIALFSGTWNASGNRSIVFSGNSFNYKVNGTTIYSGTFSVSSSTITFNATGLVTASGNYTLSATTLTFSNHTWDSSVNGTYTKDDGTAERIHVTFTDPDGGNPDRTVDIVKGDVLGGYMYTPSREGPFVFYGWFKDQDQYFPNTPISVDITLTARWVSDDNIVTVSFTFTQKNSAGDVIQPTAAIPPVTVIKGSALGPAFPVTPISKGWEFDSWLLGEYEFTVDTVVTNDITVTAKWVAKAEYTVTFNTGLGGSVPAGYTVINNTDGTKSFQIKVFANECIDEWETRFPSNLSDNTVNSTAFFVAWFDNENREYTGRTPITGNVIITAKWGVKPYTVKLRMVADGGDILTLDPCPDSSDGRYGGVNYAPVVREAWDSTPGAEKWVIVNSTTYDVPYNTNRWRILYRIGFQWPSSFNTAFYSKYTIRARFYANQQGAASWTDETAFTPNIPAAAAGYSGAGWLKKAGYGEFNEDGTMKEYSRSDDNWGQISWTSEANWNGQGADVKTMLQRYCLDRKGGTINDIWAPLRNPELNPPFLLIQTSDAYIGHIEVTEIVFHNGEEKYTMYVDEEGYDEADDGEN